MEDETQHAAVGAGPLLQRDYWAAFAETSLSPSQLMAHVKSRFCELPPPALVNFQAPGGVGRNAELDIQITGAQDCRVRVVHDDPQSLTLGTLDGHPEAGRITFGAYRHATGRVIFHIRSRARSATATHLLGFLTVGEAMQTNTWTDFINRTAASTGLRIDGAIRATTEAVDDTPEDDSFDCPTFHATGD